MVPLPDPGERSLYLSISIFTYTGMYVCMYVFGDNST